MSKMEQMKALVEERLTTAVEDILGIIENIIKYYEEKDSRSKFDILLKPKITLQRADPQQVSVCKDDVPPEQQERSPSLDQEDPEPPLIKEEEEETWTSQEGDQLQGLEETDTKDSIYTVTCLGSLHAQHQSQFPHLHQTVENREGESLPSTSTAHMGTEADGEGCEDSEPTSDCQTISSDCSVAESEDTDRDEDMVESEGHQSGLKTKTSQTVERQSSAISSKESMESSHLRSASQNAATCKVCGRSFTYYASFMKHVGKHIKDTPRVCGVCGKQVVSTENFLDHLKSHNITDHSMHMIIHTGSKPYSCSVCGKGFRHHHDVQYHMTTHTGERPYSCSVCGNAFINSSDLQMHMKNHTGERPHICSVCGKGFITNSALQRHMKTHTGERPYSCSVCGKGFITNSALQMHMRTHTGERPYSCSVCGKGFIRRDRVQDHMKSHTGERP